MHPDSSRQTPSQGSSLIGRRLGVYEVQALVGAGGMGEVYRAHDTRLGRDVAIKVLPQAFTADADRLARFEREARMLATLNHPNIAAIHGIEESGGITGLVLEFVDGVSLDERIRQGRGSRSAGLPLDEVVGIARQTAEALEAAHERGIIHRDFKPANIRMTPQGVVKVLDFGVAKALDDGRAGAAPVDLATVMAAATEAGLIVGTVGYMSPEQARGKPVDTRTDIWAYGCVIFELLTGQMAFGGDTASDVVAAVLEREPAWDRLPADTPPALRHLMKRCLEKDPRRRLRDIGEARIALEPPFALTAPNGPDQPPIAITRRMAISALAGAAAGAGVTFLGITRGPGAPARAAARFAIALPDGEVISSSHLRRIAISADGSHAAFNVVRPGGTGQILVRALNGLEMKPPGDGVGGGSPFFSPDNRWLGYLVTSDGQRLRKVALSGGAPVTVCNYQDSQPAGATWATPDTIYFVSSIPGGISRVSPDGGEPTEVVTIDFDNGERMHKWPHALPGGDTVVYTLATADSESFDDTLIAAYSMKTRQRQVLVEGGTSPSYSPSGHLVYARNGMLLAVPFDAQRLEVTGEPFTALEGVMMSRNTGVANFDISATGDLIYVPGKADGGARYLVWVDRNGAAERLPLPSQSYLRPRLSPDGHKLAIEVEGSNHDIHVYNFGTGVMSNITTDGVSHWPIWSPDGTRIGYRAGQMGQFRLWHVPADRSGPARQIPADGPWQSMEAFSPDGKMVLYATSRSRFTPKLELAPIEGGAAAQPLDEGKFAQGSAKLIQGTRDKRLQRWSVAPRDRADR
ncbi:MAG TPA: protein kinase [Vicinamibacterales bacterium]|nr:protein kinase [Vicinamibacterales bacterium]